MVCRQPLTHCEGALMRHTHQGVSNSISLFILPVSSRLSHPPPSPAAGRTHPRHQRGLHELLDLVLARGHGSLSSLCIAPCVSVLSLSLSHEPTSCCQHYRDRCPSLDRRFLANNIISVSLSLTNVTSRRCTSTVLRRLNRPANTNCLRWKNGASL